MTAATSLDAARTVIVRRATSRDTEAIIELCEGLRAQSRYARFFTPVPSITATIGNSLSDLDVSTVWLAFVGDACIGWARLTSSDGQEYAELALTVADEHQGRGLGQRLAQVAVGDRVRDGGCASVSILPTNDAAARLARRNHVRLHFDGDGFEGHIAANALSKTR